MSWLQFFRHTTYTFNILVLNGKRIDNLGDKLKKYEQLREVYLNGNASTNIDRLRTLSLVQILEAKDNKIMDNYSSWSESILAETSEIISLKYLQTLNLTETSIAEEKRDNLKKEVLIIPDGLDTKIFNGEEVSTEDIADTKNETNREIKGWQGEQKVSGGSYCR